MPAYLIAISAVKNPEKLAEYAAGAGPTLAQFEGKPIARGEVKEVLAGKSDGQIAIVVEFPSAEKAHAWYHSDVYQKLIPTRDQAIDPTFLVVEAPQ